MRYFLVCVTFPLCRYVASVNQAYMPVLLLLRALRLFYFSGEKDNCIAKQYIV